MRKDKGRPSFVGWRSQGQTREQRKGWCQTNLELAKSILDAPENHSEGDLSAARRLLELAAPELEAIAGAPGQAWDRVVTVLDAALLDPVIGADKTAIEFLAIVRSLAQSAEIYTVESVLCELDDVFKSQRAWTNAINSYGSPEPRWWLQRQWIERTDRDQKKAPFARQYLPLLFQKFRVKVTAEQVIRVWLRGM